MQCGDGELKVLQIIPAPEGAYVAVFDAVEGGGDPNRDTGGKRSAAFHDFYTEPVVCWMLVEHVDVVSHVHPGVCLGTVVDDACFVANYLFVTPKGSDVAALVASFRAGRVSK